MKMADVTSTILVLPLHLGDMEARPPTSAFCSKAQRRRKETIRKACLEDKPIIIGYAPGGKIKEHRRPPGGQKATAPRHPASRQLSKTSLRKHEQTKSYINMSTPKSEHTTASSRGGTAERDEAGRVEWRRMPPKGFRGGLNQTPNPFREGEGWNLKPERIADLVKK